MFQIGDKVKVIATLEELEKINAKGTYEKNGFIIGYCSLFATVDFLDGTYTLPFPYLDLIQEDKFKKGDVVRLIKDYNVYNQKGSLFVIFAKDDNDYICSRQFDFSLNVSFAIPQNFLERVTSFNKGDKFWIPPLEVTVEDTYESPGFDSTYEVKLQNGNIFELPNEYAPKGTCRVPQKFEVGELVIVNEFADEKQEEIGVILLVEDYVESRYCIKFGEDTVWFSGNELIKIPQDLFPEIKAIIMRD